MAYTIVKSDGSVLTTIADGTIETTSTSLGLPGRSFSGYGEVVNTNFVQMIENFASAAPPANPLRGQLWFNTSTNVMSVCPSDGESNAAAWLTLASGATGGSTSFGNVSVSGNISGNNLSITNSLAAGAVDINDTLSVGTSALINNATLAGATNITSVNTTAITTGGPNASGTLIGTWTVNGSGIANSISGTALNVTGGNLVITGPGAIGIRTDNYYFANGAPLVFPGTYSNANVSSFLPTFVGNVGALGSATSFNGRNLSAGTPQTTGNITGTWTLTPGSTLQATYADLAERFESDRAYSPGTVVKIGGPNEVTIVVEELSEEVFGVVSNTAAYLMNATAGPDETHPPIALVGRVTIRTIGEAKKGDRLVSAGNGTARAAAPGEATAFNVIGRALRDKTTQEEDLLESVVVIR
jgi:hypothetical protein